MRTFAPKKAMQINTSSSNSGDRYALLPGRQEQPNTALQTALRPVNRPLQSALSSTSTLQRQTVVGSYSSYPIQNINTRHAILSYQQASRFEENQSVPMTESGSNQDARWDETTLTKILQEEPKNRAAWYNMGIIYSQQEDRDKVSAVYQILKTLDSRTADQFSTQVGLDEKRLLDII